MVCIPRQGVGTGNVPVLHELLVRAAVRLVWQRRHLASAARRVTFCSGFALSGVQHADRLVRQRAPGLVVGVVGQVPVLRLSDLLRYPAVELISGLLWMAAAIHFGLSWQTAVCIVFFYVLLLLAFIDIDTMRLPNQLVGLLAIIGAGSLAITQFTDITAAPLMPLGQGLLSIPVVYGLFGALISAGSVRSSP